MVSGDEFIKWKSRYLDNHVVKCRLKAGICLLGNGVLDLIQIVSKGNLG